MAGRREDKRTDSRVADAQPQLMKHTPLVTQDLTGLVGKEGVLVKVEYAPGASDTKHAHPGYLFTYILEGAAVWEVDGQWAEAHHDRAQTPAGSSSAPVAGPGRHHPDGPLTR